MMGESEKRSPWRVGIVGTGYAAKQRAEAIHNDDRAELVGFSGRSAESRAQFARTYGTNAFETPEALLAEAIDLLFVCHINRDHARIVRLGLEAGKHVVVEYPLALDPADAEALIQLARERDRLLHVEHIELLGGLHQTARDILSELGEIAYARYTTVTPQRPAPRRWTYHRDEFGFPFCAAVSRVHRLTDLLGTVERVSADARFWDAGGGYFRACLCTAQLRFANGAIADLTYGKGEVFWHPARRFELHGDRASVVFEGSEGTLFREGEERAISAGGRRGLFALDTAYVLDRLTSGTPLYLNPEASLYALRVADAIRRSAVTGEAICKRES